MKAGATEYATITADQAVHHPSSYATFHGSDERYRAGRRFE